MTDGANIAIGQGRCGFMAASPNFGRSNKRRHRAGQNRLIGRLCHAILQSSRKLLARYRLYSELMEVEMAYTPEVTQKQVDKL